MKVWDFHCLICDWVYEDELVRDEDMFICPDCGVECEKLFTKLRFNSRFADSHKNTYDKYKRR